jgi:hypothetical protein
VVPATGDNPRSVTDEFDESPFLIEWKPGGIRGASASILRRRHVTQDLTIP